MANGIQQQAAAPKVRCPVIPTELPSYPELRVKKPPYASIFEGLADNENGMMGYRFLKSLPIVVAPFAWNYRRNTRTGVKTVNNTEQTRYVSFRTSPLARLLFIGVGYSAVQLAEYLGQQRNFASMTVKVSEVPGDTTPGSGTTIDPGIQWRGFDGNIPNPVVNGEYAAPGLKWLYTPLAEPAAVVATDPVTLFPRLLVVPGNTQVELAFTWESLTVNALLIAEAYRPEV